MATTETPAAKQTEQPPIRPATADQVPISRFDQMVERMKGTGRIVGDIVSPDPEIWNCEIE